MTLEAMTPGDVTAMFGRQNMTATFLTADQYQVLFPKPPAVVDLNPLLNALNATPTMDAKLTALIALLQAKGFV